jgi:hypothetical protein
MNRIGWLAAVAVVACCLTPVVASASPILLSTPNIISGPEGLGPAVIVTTQPTPPWVPGTWWAPNVDQTFDPNAYHAGTGNLPGDYLYRLSFDLTGYDPSTASMSGVWTTDNDGQIILNGVLMGSIGPTAYGTTTPFSFTSGFVSGMNYLDFLVHNEFPAAGSPWAGPLGQNPTGLYYQLVGVNGLGATAVPEPTTLVLCGIGALFVANRLRRRQ